MTTPALIWICLGSIFFLVTLAAIIYICYRHRSSAKSLQKPSSVVKKHHSEKSSIFQKVTTVKSHIISSISSSILVKKYPSSDQQKVSWSENITVSQNGGSSNHRLPLNREGDKCIITLTSSKQYSQQNYPIKENKKCMNGKNVMLQNKKIENLEVPTAVKNFNRSSVSRSLQKLSPARSLKKLSSVLKKSYSEKPLVVQKSTAIKDHNSSSVISSILVKDSPSPTEQKKCTRVSPNGGSNDHRPPLDIDTNKSIITLTSSNHSPLQNSLITENKKYIDSDNVKLNTNKVENLVEPTARKNPNCSSVSRSMKKLSSVIKKHCSEKPLVLQTPSAMKSHNISSVSSSISVNESYGAAKQKMSPSESTRVSPISGSNIHRSPFNIDSDKPITTLTFSNHSSEENFLIIANNKYIDSENENLKNNRIENSEEKKEKLVLLEKQCKLGQLHFRLKYSSEKLSLQVNIVKCTDLLSKESNNVSSDPYIKLQVLPEKQHKVKTRVLRKTLDPVYDENFTFCGITPNHFQTITLHFVVLNFDRYSRDDVIGEVICPLSSTEIESGEQVELAKEITPKNLEIQSQERGELLVSLYQSAMNRLSVVVLEARNLPKMDFTGLCDPYVKIYLLHNNQRIEKKKTHIKKKTTDPVFNESFVFEVPYNESLANISLEILVLDWDRVTKNEIIGRLELSSEIGGLAQQHWNEMCRAPRCQITEWHKLVE